MWVVRRCTSQLGVCFRQILKVSRVLDNSGKMKSRDPIG